MTVSLLAQPWWVNLLLLVPILFFLYWRRKTLALGGTQLVYSGLFAAAFGFMEAVVVVYLRAMLAQVSGYGADLEAVARISADFTLHPQNVAAFPPGILRIEAYREAATILMLAAVALLTVPRRRERWAIFLWCFALWDLVYYAGLWATLRWPASPGTPDILFLIPVPWVAQVWLPITVSLLTIAAVLAGTLRHKPSEN